MQKCIYCSAEYGGGYCVNSPNGNHQIEDYQPSYGDWGVDDIKVRMKELENDIENYGEVLGSDMYYDLREMESEWEDLQTELYDRHHSDKIDSDKNG